MPCSAIKNIVVLGVRFWVLEVRGHAQLGENARRRLRRGCPRSFLRRVYAVIPNLVFIIAARIGSKPVVGRFYFGLEGEQLGVRVGADGDC